MPIYEFVCQNCGTEFEKIQSFSETNVPTCLSCQSLNVSRKMSRPAIHFKGSGWYVTDSKGGGNGASAKDSAKEGAKEKTGDSAEKVAKTDTVETKPEPAKTSSAPANTD